MRRAEALEHIERSLGAIGRVGSSVSGARRRAAQAGVDVSAPGMGILGVLDRGSPLRVSTLARKAGMVNTLASRELRPYLTADEWDALLDDVRAELRRHLVDGRLQFNGAAWLVTASNVR